MLSLHQLDLLPRNLRARLAHREPPRSSATPSRSVSEQIRTLEKSLGVQLFRRVGRGVVPTTVADTLRPHAERRWPPRRRRAGRRRG